ncbi:MAG: hypothetical protein AVDCRST_MAG57-1276 [uncultured Blastococcus sp.]|uniref:LysM domain-containing protein n=1 Tax=uncultured Blastococcus sp. TaxID=217144 RepID=A0A6J4HWT9_9ACTN|nr:MAG: hypothetical protein AVDCRST_MAG57-1276 [uncultured Blastococcus sp.]
MGSAQQAVLEFDEEVRAPWRPRLVPELVELPDEGAAALRAPQQRRPTRPNPSRVGVCRPPAERRPVRRADPPSGGRDTGLQDVAGRPVRPRRPASARPIARRTRLTRRARRLAAVLLLTLGVALGSWVSSFADGSGEGDLRLAGVSSVVVEPGDTLWSIASSLDGEGDVRAVVDEIQELNGLDSAELAPGQTLQLP